MEGKRAASVKSNRRTDKRPASVSRRMSTSNEMKSSYYSKGFLEQKVFDLRPATKESRTQVKFLLKLKNELEEVLLLDKRSKLQVAGAKPRKKEVHQKALSDT
jgi:hypothetical protein